MIIKYTAEQMRNLTSSSIIAKMISEKMDKAIEENNNFIIVDIPLSIFYSEEKIRHSIEMIGFELKLTKYSDFVALRIGW